MAEGVRDTIKDIPVNVSGFSRCFACKSMQNCRWRSVGDQTVGDGCLE